MATREVPKQTSLRVPTYRNRQNRDWVGAVLPAKQSWSVLLAHSIGGKASHLTCPLFWRKLHGPRRGRPSRREVPFRQHQRRRIGTPVSHFQCTGTRSRIRPGPLAEAPWPAKQTQTLGPVSGPSDGEAGRGLTRWDATGMRQGIAGACGVLRGIQNQKDSLPPQPGCRRCHVSCMRMRKQGVRTYVPLG